LLNNPGGGGSRRSNATRRVRLQLERRTARLGGLDPGTTGASSGPNWDLSPADVAWFHFSWSYWRPKLSCATTWRPTVQKGPLCP